MPTRCPRTPDLTLLLGLTLACGLTAGCSGSSSSTDGGAEPAFDAGIQGCMVQFSGDFSDSVSPDGGCGGLMLATDGGSGDGGADWQLVFNVFSNFSQANTAVSIDLGSQPSTGTFNADNLQSWSAVSVTQALCEFSAGDQSVPTGTFTLTLSSVGPLSGSGPVAVHGALEVEQYVQQPPGSNCGPDDTETIAFEF